MSQGGAALHLPRPPRRRLLLGLLAAVLVNGAWLLLLQLQRPSVGGAASRLISLRILPEELEAVRPERLREPKPRGAPRAAVAVPTPEVPVPEAVAPAAPPAVPAAPATTVAVPGRPEPLKLGLPPDRPASGARGESMLSQMLNDPRANSAKRSVEYAVADAAGTLPVTVSNSTDGTGAKLIRQGSKCTRVTESRVSMLNPMDERARGLPAMAGACTR